MTDESNVSLVAVAWFRPEEWDQLKRVCSGLQNTYEEWLANAEAGIEGLGSPMKDHVVKIILTADELRKRKRATGRKIDSKERSRLAMLIAFERYKTRH